MASRQILLLALQGKINLIGWSYTFRESPIGVGVKNNQWFVTTDDNNEYPDKS